MRPATGARPAWRTAGTASCLCRSGSPAARSCPARHEWLLKGGGSMGCRAHITRWRPGGPPAAPVSPWPCTPAAPSGCPRLAQGAGGRVPDQVASVSLLHISACFWCAQSAECNCKAHSVATADLAVICIVREVHFHAPQRELRHPAFLLSSLIACLTISLLPGPEVGPPSACRSHQRGQCPPPFDRAELARIVTRTDPDSTCLSSCDR